MNVFGLFSIPNPLWLIGIPIAGGVLVYVYRRRGSGTRVLVATTLLLQQLPQELKSRSSFLPPLRFFFELLLCTLLLFTLAGVQREQESKNIAVLIDNSFHTRATFSNETRFARIIDKARASITSLSKNTTVTLFKTAPVPTQIGEPFLSTTEAWEAVENIQSVESGGELQDAAEYISKQKLFENLYVFSDQIPAPDYKPQKSVYYFPLASIGPENNIAIREVSWLPESAERPLGTIKTTIAVFSEIESKGKAILECVNDNFSLTAIDSTELRFSAGSTITATFERVPADMRACRVTISPSDTRGGLDAIADDNSRWVVKDSSSNSILVVSDFSPQELGLHRITQYSFAHQLPAEYLVQPENNSSNFKATLLHRVSLPTRPNANTILIAPDSKVPFLNTKIENNARLARLNSGHPIVRYVNFSSITLSQAQSFEPSLFLYPVVHANKGALLLAGETTDFRMVVSGFEMLPFSGKDQPTLSILLLNIFKWTLASAESSTTISPFQRIDVAASDTLRYLPEAGKLPLTSLQNNEALPQRSGLLIHETNTTSKLIAVGQFDPQESDLRTPRTFAQPNFAASEARASDNALSYWLLIAITLLLATDMFVMTGLSFLKEARS